MSRFLVREIVLLILSETREGLDAVELTAMVQLHRASVRGVLCRLLSDGLVVKRKDRRVVYTLTDKGSELANTQRWRLRNRGLCSVKELLKGAGS